jgi:YD repeat-containing protein
MQRLLRSTITIIGLVALARFGSSQTTGQSESGAVRVTVALHPDGSRTVYKFDDAQHSATATTTGDDGTVRQKISYQLDDAGRYVSANIFGPDDKLRFKSRYQYDSAGRLQEELRMDPKDTLLNKIVYDYNQAGKQIGYSVLDANGKLINRVASTPPLPVSSPTPRKKR